MKKTTILIIISIFTNALYSQEKKIEGLKTIRDTTLAHQEPESKRISNAILSPFNVSIGSNFDFINGVDLTDLYFNISTFSPNLVKIGTLKLGLITGVRKSFARTYDKFLSNIAATRKYSENNLLFQQNYTIKSTSDLGLVNTTFYFSPVLTLTENSIPETKNKFSCYLGFNFDLKKQELLWDFLYDTLNIETEIINQNQFNEITNTSLPAQEIYDQFIYSAGITLPFIIENSHSAFIGNFNVGYSNIRRQDFWNWDRLNVGLSFEIIEKEFGLNLRSEIQYFSVNNPPYIAFSIAKYFNLKDLIKFVPE